MAEGYMTTTDAARELGISVTALYSRIQAGTVKAERFGSRVLMVPRSEVERLKGVGKLKRGPKPGRSRKRQADDAC